jgi:hypothetical protein
MTTSTSTKTTATKTPARKAAPAKKAAAKPAAKTVAATTAAPKLTWTKNSKVEAECTEAVGTRGGHTYTNTRQADGTWTAVYEFEGGKQETLATGVSGKAAWQAAVNHHRTQTTPAAASAA